MSQQFTASGWLKPLGLGLVIPLAAASYVVGCKKDEPPPPLPSAAPAAPAPTPTAALELAPEDAGVVDAAEDADAGKKVGTGGGSSLKACCAALRQNAKSAPPPNNQYMELAAAACESGASLPVITTALRGAGLPAGCK
jgi:hypothetical protein